MLSHSEIDMKVLYIGMKTIGFNEYRVVSRVNKVANDILAIIYGRIWFFYKDRQKVINIFTQSINRLYYISQLYLKTKK